MREGSIHTALHNRVVEMTPILFNLLNGYAPNTILGAFFVLNSRERDPISSPQVVILRS
ncbi:hypothetical protein OSCI_1340001 [Kamptonema sp. PCC 6506]|nr:hypothetical protein OSCI_1340001 [Kamptonema sp. PCC 6506]